MVCASTANCGYCAQSQHNLLYFTYNADQIHSKIPGFGASVSPPARMDLVTSNFVSLNSVIFKHMGVVLVEVFHLSLRNAKSVLIFSIPLQLPQLEVLEPLNVRS